MIERKALIFNIQKYNMYDGPGVRTLVFFKGCPLRCRWCSNPEGQLRRFEVLYKKNACVHCGACVSVCPEGIHRMSLGHTRHEVARDAECVGCRKCETACKAGALAVSGEMKSISSLLAVIEEDRPFYETSGGGVTLGGGEVLMQPEAAASLLTACKQQGINTALETCGYARPETLRAIAEHTELFLFDIKHMDSDRHHEQTGVRNESILSNLVWLLENKHAVKIRIPLLKGVNDGEDNLSRLIDFLRPHQTRKNFKGVDILPYHKMGVGKYGQLGREYPVQSDAVLTEADLARVENRLQQENFTVSVIRH